VFVHQGIVKKKPPDQNGVVFLNPDLRLYHRCLHGLTRPARRMPAKEFIAKRHICLPVQHAVEVLFAKTAQCPQFYLQRENVVQFPHKYPVWKTHITQPRGFAKFPLFIEGEIVNY